MVEMRRIRELMGRLCEGVNDHGVLDKVWISYTRSPYDASRFVNYGNIYSREAYENEMADKDPNNRMSYQDFVQLRQLQLGNTNKPFYFGLWASPVDSEWGWRNFCMDNGWNLDRLTNRFLFRLSPDSKIYVVDDVEDLDAVSTFGMNGYGWKTIDFHRLVDEGFDGIYATKKGVRIEDDAETRLRGLDLWDVESVCVFNKDVIIPIDDESLFPDDSEVDFLRSISHDPEEIYDLVRTLKKDQSQWTEDDWETVNSFTDDEIEKVKERKLR